jgi:hypothetical protein
MAGITQTVYTLEMTAPTALVPARVDAEVRLRETPPTASEVRSAYQRIFGPPRNGGRADWSIGHRERQLSKIGVCAWIALGLDEAVGLVELEAESTGDVGIVVFGLFPEFIGRGLGGIFLTEATRLAWR